MDTLLEKWVKQRELVALMGFEDRGSVNPKGYIKRYDTYGIEFEKATGYRCVIFVPWSSFSHILPGQRLE